MKDFPAVSLFHCPSILYFVISTAGALCNRCVEGKKDGLREGDECVDEAEMYKNCRKLVKDAKLQEDAEAVPAS